MDYNQQEGVKSRELSLKELSFFFPVDKTKKEVST